MIRIRPERPSAPSPENIKQFTGRTLNIERAVAILQLPGDENGPLYSPAMVAASAWEKGTAEYSKAFRGFHYLATRYLKETGPGRKKQPKAWSAVEWRTTLTLEMHEKASAIINAICDRNDNRLAKGLHQEIVYCFSGETNEILEKIGHPKHQDVNVSFVGLEEERRSLFEQKVRWILRPISLNSSRLRISALAALIIILAIIGVDTERNEESDKNALSFASYILNSEVPPLTPFPRIETHSNELGWDAPRQDEGPGGVFALMNGPPFPY